MSLYIHSNLQIVHQQSDFSEALPWELWVYIFSLSNPQTVVSLSLVCKKFYQCSIDQGLWHLFCKSLSLYQDGEEGDFRLIYQRTRNLERNVQAMEYVEIPHSFPAIGKFFASSDLMCFPQSEGIEIYSTSGSHLHTLENGSQQKATLIKIINLVRQIVDLVNDPKNVSEPQDLSQRISPHIEALVQVEENVSDAFLKEKIKLLSGVAVIDLTTVFSIYGCATYGYQTLSLKVKSFVSVTCFAASSHYFAIAVSTGAIKIWDRESFQEIHCVESVRGSVVSMELTGSSLFIRYASKELILFDIEKKQTLTLGHDVLVLSRFSDAAVVFLTPEDELVCINNEGKKKKSKPFSIKILDICFDENQKNMAVISQIDSKWSLNIYEIKDNEELEFSLFLHCSLKYPVVRLKWKHDAIWIGTCNGSLLKMSLTDASPKKILSDCCDYHWLKDRLFYSSRRSTQLLDFSASFKEIEEARIREEEERTEVLSNSEFSTDSDDEEHVFS